MKKAAEALEWLGLRITEIFGVPGALRVEIGTLGANLDPGLPEHMNAPARDLILDALERQKERDAEIVEAEPELLGAMPNEIWAKLRKETMEGLLRTYVRVVKKSIAAAIRNQDALIESKEG